MIDPDDFDAPLPVLAIEDESAQISVAAKAAGRFCRACGAPWQAAWTECEPCQHRAMVAQINANMEEAERGPSVGSAIFLYFALLTVSLVAIVAILLKADALSTEFVAVGFQSAVVVGWCIFGWKDILPAIRKPVAPLWFVLSAGMAVGTFILAFAILHALTIAFNLPTERLTDLYTQNEYGWLAMILSIAVQPAIFEELAFRGVIFSSLRRVLGPSETILVSALMFMALHLMPLSFAHLFVIGLALAWLRHRTGSMLPGMLLHFTHNLLCVVADLKGYS